MTIRLSGMDNWHLGPLAGFDLETTGVDRETDRVVTASLVRSDGPEFEPSDHGWLVNPGDDIVIPDEAAQIHGIDTKRARRDGMDAATAIAEIAMEFWDLVKDGRPVVIYNAAFDLTMLDRECRRYGVTSPMQRGRFRVLDPLVIDKHCDPYVKGKGQRQLTPTCARYGIELTGAHDALADTLASVNLMRAIAARWPRIRSTPVDKLQSFQRSWQIEQVNGLAAFFGKTAIRLGREGKLEEAQELEAKQTGCAAEAGHWPFRPFVDSTSLTG